MPDIPSINKKYLSGVLPASIVVLIFKKTPRPLLPEYKIHMDKIQIAEPVMPDCLCSMMRMSNTKKATNTSAN